MPGPESGSTPFSGSIIRAIVALLARLTGDRAQAEEIAADVFCKVSQRGPLGLGGEDPAPWLYRVATNAGLDALRSNTRRRRREEAAGVETCGSRRGRRRSTTCCGRNAAPGCGKCSARLKPRDAQLLLLRAEGLAYRELAEALGSATRLGGHAAGPRRGGVRAAVSRALRRRLMKDVGRTAICGPTWIANCRPRIETGLGGASGGVRRVRLRYREIPRARSGSQPHSAPWRAESLRRGRSRRPAGQLWPRWAAAVAMAAGLAMLLVSPKVNPRRRAAVALGKGDFVRAGQRADRRGAGRACVARSEQCAGRRDYFCRRARPRLPAGQQSNN